MVEGQIYGKERMSELAAPSVPSISSGSLIAYTPGFKSIRARVQDFNDFSKSTVLPVMGALGGGYIGANIGGFPLAAVFTGLGAMTGGAITAQSPAERNEMMGYVFQGVTLAGQFSLAMTRVQQEFIMQLALMASREANEQARAWLSWYGLPQMQQLPPDIQEAITSPGVMADPDRPFPAPISDDERTNRIVASLMENLSGIRRTDPDSFDAIITGGRTIGEDFVPAFIDHQNGKRYFRGYKHIDDLSPLETYSDRDVQDRKPLTERDIRQLARQGRPVGGRPG